MSRVLLVGFMGESLLFCDVKMEHFGLDSQGRLKLLDGGDLMFRSRAGNAKESILLLWTNLVTKVSSKFCSLDGDCQHLNCKGRCDESTQRHAKNFNSTLMLSFS